MFPLFWNMGRDHCSMVLFNIFFISGVSDLCMYKVMTTLPNPECLRSPALIPFSPVMLEIASKIRRRSVIFPKVPFGNGWTHRLHTVSNSRSNNTRTISFFASISITCGNIPNLLTAGLLFAMLVASTSAAASICFRKAIPSSSNWGRFFFSFFFFCMRRHAAWRALEALVFSSPSSSVRLILSTPPPLFLPPSPFLFIFFSSSESYSSGLSSSKCCSAYSSLSASGSSSSASMKSSSSLVRSMLTESYESPDLYPLSSLPLPSLSPLGRFFRGSSSPFSPPPPPARFLAKSSMRSFMLRVSFLGFFAAAGFLAVVLRFFPNFFFFGPDSSSLEESKRPAASFFPSSKSESSSASGVSFLPFFFVVEAPPFLRAMGCDLAAAMRSSVSASEEESPKRSSPSLAMLNEFWIYEGSWRSTVRLTSIDDPFFQNSKPP
mmetsp:Transcript_17849/g.32267  ORF Transcript_17849/g.32267 Transcript_17849/m.32267 type:complete len:435 (+) Transcript_17849:577-1881(+)